MRAVSQDKSFWYGAWRGGVVGAVGGALSMVGGGTFVANVAWGMGGGAITGGLDAALWGNNIGKGMLYGAAIGGAFAAATSGIESFKNYRDYGKFGTNVGVYDRMVNDVQSAYLNNDFQQLNSSLKTLNEFGSDRFGFYSDIEFNVFKSNATPDGRASVSFFDRTSDGFVRRSGAAMRRSMAHESAHISNIYVNVEGKEEISRNFFQGDDLFVQGVNHGTVGYFEPIRNAGRLHLGFSVLELNRPGTMVAWNQFGWRKWLYAIPKRF